MDFKLDLEDVGAMIYFGKIKTGDQLRKVIAGQWEFRKDKNIDDINKALMKGVRMGKGKSERELDCIALYLKDVLKKVRGKVR